jgi:GNAT superfamily N-acetyltransferase
VLDAMRGRQSYRRVGFAFVPDDTPRTARAPVARGGAFQTEVQAPRTAPEFGGVRPVPRPAQAAPAPVAPQGPSYEGFGEVVRGIEAKNPGIDLFASYSPNTNAITVSKIVVPKEGRGQGVGTAAMQEILDYADQHGLAVALTPSADFGGTKKRLVEFYKRLGFVNNTGKNRDLSIGETMIRPPQARPVAPVAAPAPTPAPAAQVLDDIATGRYQSAAPNLPTQPVKVTRRPTVAPATPAEAPVQAPAPTRQITRQVARQVEPEAEPAQRAIWEVNDLPEARRDRILRGVLAEFKQKKPNGGPFEEVDLGGGVRLRRVEEIAADPRNPVKGRPLAETVDTKEGPVILVQKDVDGDEFLRVMRHELDHVRQIKQKDFRPLADREQDAYAKAGIPTPKEYAPAPKPTPAPREATGLANQVQEREALAGIIRDPEKGLSRDAAFFQRRGKELVEQGQADPDAVAREIANGKGINADDFGVMLEGKRRKTLAVNAARKKLDLAIAGKSEDVPRLRAEYEAAQADLQGFLDNVQKGKTEWSNIGRSLQAGTELNTGDFAEVLAEARRVKGGAVDAATEQRLKDLTEDIARRDAQIAELEATAKRLEAEGVAQSVRPDQPAPQIVKPGYRVTFTGEIRLADGTRISAGDAADLVRLARAAKQGAEAVKALQDEWGADRLAELSKLGQKLKGTDALQARAQWERARAEWEDGQLSAEWADQRRQDALETLRRLLASSTKKSDSYFAEALDAKGRPVRKQAKYREFSRTDATEDERREILRMILDANPSLEGKEWTIPGFGKGGLESLIVDAGIFPEEVANRYSLKPGLGGRKGPRLQPSLEGHASEPKTIAPKRVAIRQEREKILADLDAILKDAGKINDLGSATYDAVRFGYVAGKLALNYMKEGVAVLDEVVEQVIADLKARGLSVTREQVIDDLMEVSKPAKPRTRNEATARLAALKREARELAKVQGQVRQLEAGTALPQGPKPPQAPAGGMLGELRAKRDALLKGRRQEAAAAAGAPRKERLEADRLARVQAEIKSLEAQLAGGTADPKVGPPKLRQVSQRLEEARALRDLNKRRVEALIRAQKPKTALDVAGEVANTVRGVTLGSDIGVLTRQGLFSWSRPLTAAKATLRATRAAFSETELALFERELETRRVGGKLALLERKRAGLQITDRLSNPEELVVAQLLKKIPGVRALFGDRLERFQTTFINAVRADLFDQALAAGFTPEELKLRANFINSATGRGNVRNVPKLLSVIMTSPRYEASRWEMLAQPLRNAAALGKDAATGKGLNRAALANLRDMSVTAAGIFGLFKAAELAGYSVDWNPESSDFLKMRRGEEVWDPSAGLSVRLRDVLRIYIGFTHPGYNDNWANVGAKGFVRSLSPATKIPVDAASAAIQRRRGVIQPKSPFEGYTNDDERKGLMVLAPLIVQSFTEALQKEGPGAAAWAGAREFVGQSVGRYPRSKNAPPPSKTPRLRDLLGK